MTTTGHKDEIRGRLQRAAEAVAAGGLDAMVLGAGADLRYLTGYDAHLSERFTGVVVPASGDPALVVAALEQPLAEQSIAAQIGVPILAWQETEDPYRLAVERTGGHRLAVSDRMWAQHLFGLQSTDDHIRMRSATDIMAGLRVCKSATEIELLREAAAAIDQVHASVGEWLRVGRTEREVAADVADAIRAAGHATVEFTIIGSGPNGASPHHSFSDRAIERGDLVVVDIGGTMPSGYCSDSTRTFAVGAEPDAAQQEIYEVISLAHQAAISVVRPGVTAEDVDATARSVIEEAGWGPEFLHRTGHGIGMEVHEHPYLVAGNAQELRPGMTFSVEPGIYLSGQYGARLEDIVAVTDGGADVLTAADRSLTVVPG